MILIDNVLKKFESTIAVDIDNLIINRGDSFGLIGNNGAGKTTLLKIILDLLKPSKGSVLSNGRNVYQSEHWKVYTSSYIDSHFLIEFLQPEEYFDLIASLYKIEENKLSEILLMFSGFMRDEILHTGKLIRQLSLGNKQKVGIIGALLSNPMVLILDEPFNFLDPSSQIILKQILKDLSINFGTTIIVSSHNLIHISEICTRIGLMERGKIIKDCINSHDEIREIENYFKDQINQ